MKLICCLAVIYMQSRTYAKTGDLHSAKKLGMYAVILDVCAILMAFVVAVAITSTILGLILAY